MLAMWLVSLAIPTTCTGEVTVALFAGTHSVSELAVGLRVQYGLVTATVCVDFTVAPSLSFSVSVTV